MSTTKVIFYPVPEKRLTPAEIAQEMGKLGSRDALWLALMQVLQERLASAVVESAEVVMTERASGHAAGRIAEITSFQEELLRLRTAAVNGVAKK